MGTTFITEAVKLMLRTLWAFWSSCSGVGPQATLSDSSAPTFDCHASLAPAATMLCQVYPTISHCKSWETGPVTFFSSMGPPRKKRSENVCNVCWRSNRESMNPTSCHHTNTQILDLTGTPNQTVNTVWEKVAPPKPQQDVRNFVSYRSAIYIPTFLLKLGKKILSFLNKNKYF
jgi:hypothetical protein